MTNDIKNSNNYDHRHILTTRHHHHHNACPNESLDGNAQIPDSRPFVGKVDTKPQHGLVPKLILSNKKKP